MLYYLLIGILWCWWLEQFTTGNEDVTLNGKWSWRERFFHTLLWPISITIFIVEFFRNLF